MSDQVELNVASKQSVALELTRKIASVTNMSSDTSGYRKDYLDLYAECLTAAYGQRKVNNK